MASLNPILFYKCLSEETRLKSLLLLTIKGELCVCDLTQALELSQPKVSRHLADLRKCALVEDERKGKWVYYRLHSSLPTWALEVLKLTATEQAAFFAKELARLQSTCKASCP